MPPYRDPKVVKNFRAIYENRCAICGEVELSDAHHIVPLKDGGSDSFRNLVFLCPSCHRRAGLGQISQERLFQVQRNMIRRREAPRAL